MLARARYKPRLPLVSECSLATLIVTNSNCFGYLIDTALERLFTSLPEIDIIELTVLDPVSKQKIMTGVVHRGDLEDAHSLASIKMGLREAGGEFRLTDAQLCSLDLHDELGSFCMRAD